MPASVHSGSASWDNCGKNTVLNQPNCLSTKVQNLSWFLSCLCDCYQFNRSVVPTDLLIHSLFRITMYHCVCVCLFVCLCLRLCRCCPLSWKSSRMSSTSSAPRGPSPWPPGKLRSFRHEVLHTVFRTQIFDNVAVFKFCVLERDLFWISECFLLTGSKSLVGKSLLT